MEGCPFYRQWKGQKKGCSPPFATCNKTGDLTDCGGENGKCEAVENESEFREMGMAHASAEAERES